MLKKIPYSVEVAIEEFTERKTDQDHNLYLRGKGIHKKPLSWDTREEPSRSWAWMPGKTLRSFLDNMFTWN